MRPRIVHVINDLSLGGAESALLRTAQGLADEFDQTVICLLGGGPLEDAFRKAGLPVEILDMSTTVAVPVAFRRLVTRLRDLRPQLVQTWLYHADLVGGVAALFARRLPVVWNLRSADLRESAPLVSRIVLRVCAALSGSLPVATIACSQAAADFHRRVGYHGKLHIIRNGVDVSQFRPDSQARFTLRAELGLADHTPLIGLVARVHPVKNHELFAEAARIAIQRRPDLHFVLAGNDALPTNGTLAGILDRSGVSSRTHCLGVRDDIARIIAALDVATLVSRSEGFPNVLAEAVACGVPCVATNVGAASEIIGGHGRVVVQSAAAIASAWLDVLEADEQSADITRERVARHEYVAKHFAQASSVAQYRSLYRDVMRSDR